jgi:hypothetical protein
MSRRRDEGFGGKFFQDIVAYNVRAFLHAGDSMKAAVRLNLKGGTHRQKKRKAAMQELASTMKERQLHKYRAGRTTGYRAHDDFEVGYTKPTASSRIKDFIQRTLMDAGNIHGNDTDAHEDDDLAGDYDIPLPNVLVGGVLIGSAEEENDEHGLGSDLEEED